MPTLATNDTYWQVASLLMGGLNIVVAVAFFFLGKWYERKHARENADYAHSLKRRGEVHLTFPDTSVSVHREADYEHPNIVVFTPWADGAVVINMDVKFFNERDSSTGITDFELTFEYDDGLSVDADNIQFLPVVGGKHQTGKYDSIDLPSGQWVVGRFDASVNPSEADRAIAADRLVFRARYSDGSSLEEIVATSPFLKPD